jgi:UDP-N-acetyl-D-glucosamine dehydrogenase
MRSVELSDLALAECDAVVIVTDHSSVDYQRIVDNAPIVVDTRNATRHTRGHAGTVVALAGGVVS